MEFAGGAIALIGEGKPGGGDYGGCQGDTERSEARARRGGLERASRQWTEYFLSFSCRDYRLGTCCTFFFIFFIPDFDFLYVLCVVSVL
jgi:hypothetical protein